MSRRALQLTMIVLAVRRIALAGVSLAFGVHNPLFSPSIIPEVPALDSNLRFLGGIGLGLGLLLLWIVPSIEKQTVLFRGVWLCAFLGGLARFVSLAVVGTPPVPMFASTVIEVVGAPAFIYWQHLVARSCRDLPGSTADTARN